jgi:hypothetical protein
VHSGGAGPLNRGPQWGKDGSRQIADSLTPPSHLIQFLVPLPKHEAQRSERCNDAHSGNEKEESETDDIDHRSCHVSSLRLPTRKKTLSTALNDWQVEDRKAEDRLPAESCRSVTSQIAFVLLEDSIAIIGIFYEENL